MMKLKLWPVVAGILVDSLGSLAVGILYVSVVMGVQVAGDEVTEDALTPTHLVITDILGMTLSALGGFVAGRLAKIDEVHHGAAAGFGSLVVVLLLTWSVQADTTQSWHDVLLSLAVVPVAAMGGYAAARMNTRTAPGSLRSG
jgi:putative membrane protein (TIGR04086 family)